MLSFDTGAMVVRRRTRLALATILGSLTFASASPAQLPPRGTSPSQPPTQTPPTVPDVDQTMAAVAGGTTAETVGVRAAQTSYQAKASEQALQGATARAEGAWTSYVPRVGLKASYTRLSNFTPPDLGGGGSIVVTPSPPSNTPLPAGAPLIPITFSFPLVLDNYLTQATIAIPISDYFLKISQSYSAATHAEDAARFDVLAARAKSYSDGKVAYWTWIRARGALVVAQQSLSVAQAHQKDAQNLFTAGTASRADVLRAETQVAASELALERAKSGVVVTERQIRLAMHSKEEERLEPGDALSSTLSPAPASLKPLTAEAIGQRPELKSLEKSAESARKSAEAARSARYPVVSGFGDATYANPNPRRFPATSDWFPTWSLGAQVTWSPNDYLTAGPQSADAESRAAALEAQKLTARDGVDLEVTQAYQSLIEADTAIGTTTRQLESATEGYRVARELFNAGRGTSTTLIDAENALEQTRFDYLNARVDARIARIRLEHAIGRDATVSK